LKDRRIPFLFFANKMDQAGCLTPFECCSSLKLDDIKSKPWHITYDARSAAAVRGG
jgi:ADP-ribosylation factor-like protein 6